MTYRFEDKPGPFTYRRRNGYYEVLLIERGVFHDYLRCHTEEDAIAIANFRVFQHRWEYKHAYTGKCNHRALLETLAVLPRYGIHAHRLGELGFRYRQCAEFAETLRQDGKDKCRAD